MRADVETALVGGLILFPDNIPQVAATVTPDDFAGAEAREIYETLLTLTADGKPIDPQMATAELVRRGMPQNVVNEDLAAAIAAAPLRYNVPSYAEEVSKAGRLRRMREAVSSALMGTADADQLSAELSDIVRADAPRSSGKAKPLSRVMARYYEQKNIPDKEIALDTGYKRLDDLLRGMRGTNLIVIAARPGVGKSAFALEIARSVAMQGHKVIIYSYEMSDSELAERLVARDGSITMDALDGLNPDADSEMWRKVSRACSHLTPLPISINDDPRTTIAQIRAEVLSTPGVELVIVDFLTLMRTDRRYDNRNLEVGALSRELKMLAQELRIPVIALSQLNRGKDETERPSLRDLRDSGEIEQNANKVIFLWRSDPDNPTIICVTVAKNRRGHTGDVVFQFDGNYMSFTETSIRPERPQQRRRRAYEEDE